QVVLVRIRRGQFRVQRVNCRTSEGNLAAGPRSERIEQIRRGHDDLVVERRAEAYLLGRDEKKLAEMRAVSPAEDAEAFRRPIRESERRSEVVPVAVVWNPVESVDFGRPGRRLPAQAVSQIQPRINLPLIARVNLRFPNPEAAMNIAD